MSADETVKTGAKKKTRTTRRKTRAAQAREPQVTDQSTDQPTASEAGESAANQDVADAAQVSQAAGADGVPHQGEVTHPRPGDVGTLADPATADLPRPGSLPTKAQASAAAKDKVLTSQAAVALAHDALSQITDPLSVGAHAGARSEDVRVVTHLFECNLAGYRGWRWAVTLTRPPRARTATVAEMELLPGEDAILAPAWIPWADRLRPGDVSRADRLPRRETDERLEPGWEATGEEEGDVVGTDALDFGRARVLSPEGLQRAAQRWYDGDHGPDADGVRKAHAACATCGFLIPLAGPLRNVFGICANEWAADDGQVVSLDHGCGAHSETDLPDQGPQWPVAPSRLDESAMEPIGTDGISIRQGRTQAEELAAAQVAEDDQAAGDMAGDTAQAGKAAGADGRGAADEAGEPGQAAGSGQSAVPSEDEAETSSAGRTTSSGRGPRRRRTTRRSSREADAADASADGGTSGQAAGGSQRGVAAPQAGEAAAPQEDRHAAALDAVAELAQAHAVEPVAASEPTVSAATPHDAAATGGGQAETSDVPAQSGPLTLDALEASLPLGH